MSTDGATTSPAAPRHSPWAQVAVTVAMLTVLISLILTAFAWPAARSSAHDIPIAVAGPATAADQVIAALQQRDAGAFDITRVDDTAAAEAAVRDRDVYGAIDVSTGTPQVLIASAASPVIAQTLQAVGTAMSQPAGQPTTAVRDLAPLPADDPRGAGLAAGSLPLVLGGMLAALLLTNRVRGASRRIVGALAYSITGGLAMAAILQFWLGSIEGSYWADAGAIALAVGATSVAILGLESLLGALGFGIGAATMMLLGNPFSGTTSAPEMLPGWSGQVGQFLPPGAAGHLLRSTAFFDGHGALQSVVVLTVWLLAGAVLVTIGSTRSSRRTRQAMAQPAEPALA
ncbi:membrane protein [Kineosporia mesophila]|uniref:Membrane protein n=1 Tax=Kineosporia mesophila TaxID=566012 RepID=A0ABP6Z7N3_9ACTN|nr:ABC transporter permease [Kineosporia mesophila]MCD5355011.1 ABC transporter permease [Kineosporia mesophila]